MLEYFRRGNEWYMVHMRILQETYAVAGKKHAV